ncbi:MAG: hypothetical protein AAB436_00880 [Patescibacteria group bacterium]
MSQQHEFPQDPNQHAHNVLANSQAILRNAVAVVLPDNPDANPLEVFPAPTELRADGVGLDLTPEQETQLRRYAAELGFGREENRTISDLGIRNPFVIIEGGQAHTMLAELEMVMRDEDKGVAHIMMTASPYRDLKVKETELTAKVLGIDQDEVGKTEYDVAKQVFSGVDNSRTLPGYGLEGQPIGLGYDINNGFEPIQRDTGQYVWLGHVGRLNGGPVRLLRIDRENYVEDGQPKYRNQPQTTDLIKIENDGLNMDHISKDVPIVLVTSGTYEASRNVAAARAALITGRPAAVASYGTALLAEVKGEDVPASAPINQLPGELHKMAEEVAKLEQTLRHA